LSILEKKGKKKKKGKGGGSLTSSSAEGNHRLLDKKKKKKKQRRKGKDSPLLFHSSYLSREGRKKRGGGGGADCSCLLHILPPDPVGKKKKKNRPLLFCGEKKKVVSISFPRKKSLDRQLEKGSEIGRFSMLPSSPPGAKRKKRSRSPMLNPVGAGKEEEERERGKVFLRHGSLPCWGGRRKKKVFSWSAHHEGGERKAVWCGHHLSLTGTACWEGE